MSELELASILNLLVFITVPFVGGLIAARLKLPRMIGYIISGMIMGAWLVGDSKEFVSAFGNAGLVLLLFTVGLEIDIELLRRFGRKIIGIGIAQIVITWIVYGLIVMVFGLGLQAALVVGFACALSSTALVSKHIQESGDEHSLVGGLSLGILLLQDLAVIPYMIIMSSVGRQEGILALVGTIGVSFIKSGVIIGLIYWLSTKLIPVLLSRVAVWSRELLNLFTLILILFFVAVFTWLGLSPALAAFVAGILIGGTLEHYHIFTEMRPLRDIFTILFFVYLGASIDVNSVFSVLPLALLLAVLLIVGKVIISMFLFIKFHFHSKTAFVSGVMLAQIGEFAFIVLHQSQELGILDEKSYALSITATLLTIAISPLLMDKKDALFLRMRRLVKKIAPSLEQYVTARVDREPAHIDALSLKDHVIICGYGRVGTYIGRALSMAQIPFIAIDYNFHRVEEHRKKGINIIYGDPTDIDILDFAQAEYALALISAVPDAFSQEMIILNAKTLNPQITILSRVSLEAHQRRMKDLGAHIVVHPEFEAALSIVRKVLVGFNVPDKDIVGKIKRLKLEHGMG